MENKLEVAFCAVPMMGHLNPLLPYAAELLRRGHSVTFFHEAHPRYRQKLEHCGLGAATSVTYDGSSENGRGPQRGVVFDCVVSHYASRGGENLNTKVSSSSSLADKDFSPPVIMVFDFFAVEAADAADFLNFPSVGVFPNPRSINQWAATLEQQQSSFQWAAWCQLMWGLEPLFARLLWCVRSWRRWKQGLPFLVEQDIYPTPYMPRPVLGCTTPLLEFPELPSAPLLNLVGPALTEPVDPLGDDLQAWLDVQKNQNRSVVYVAFGTMHRHTVASVQQLEAELLELGDRVAVVWSLPEADQAALQQKPSPSHWMIQGFVPQVALLQTGQVGLFVTHCGSNSVYEALLCGVPMVCCPRGADQPANATRLARAGVGALATYHKRTKSYQVGTVLHELLLESNGNDKIMQMTEASRVLAEKLRANPAAPKAADWIEEIAAAAATHEEGTTTNKFVNTKRRIPWWPFLMAAVVAPSFYLSRGEWRSQRSFS